MTLKKRIVTLLLSFLLLFVIGGETFLSAFGITASAEMKTTSVIEDLTAIENFNAGDYPALSYKQVEALNKDSDPTNDQPLVEVIQVAESSSDYLYIYLYQPTIEETEYTINGILMYNGFSPDGVVDSKLYSVDLLSREGVFSKYRVRDFTVENKAERYYNIPTLYRSYIDGVDSASSGSDLENYSVGLHVGQQWCAYEKDGKTVYEMNTFETVDLDIGFTGSARFTSGLTIGNFFGKFDMGEMWFIAFDVENFDIEKIFNADMVYKTRKRTFTVIAGDESYDYGEFSDFQKITLREGEKITYKGPGLAAKTYSWDKILSSDDFLKELEEQDVTSISNEVKENLKENPWVFTFLQTEIEQVNAGTYYQEYGTDVDSAGVIRLHFMDVNKIEYNLGVVSDLVNPDNKPDISGGGLDLEYFDKFFEILAIIAILLLIVVLFPFIKVLVSVIYSGIILIFNILISILAFPFRCIGWFFRK